jgi:hypothetical protein
MKEETSAELEVVAAAAGDNARDFRLRISGGTGNLADQNSWNRAMNTYKRHRFPRLRAPQISSATRSTAEPIHPPPLIHNQPPKRRQITLMISP